MKLLKLLFYLAFLGVIAAPARAQDYQQLREAILQQQVQTRSQIDEIDALIHQYKQRYNTANRKYEEIYKQYENLARLLVLQKKKVSSLQKERDQINKEIAVTQQKISRQQAKLEQLIADYKKTLRYLYKNGRTSQLALILSSASINQMMIRNYYLKKFETYRQKQAAEIRQTQKDLQESKQQLDGAAGHNKKVLAEIEVEKKELQKKTNQQQANVKLLRQDKQQIQKKLKAKEQQKKELNDTLSGLISREEAMRKEEEERRKRLAAQRKKNAATPSSPAENNAPDKTENKPTETPGYVGTVGYVSDEKLNKIEASFSRLKGALPWPVKSTTVSEHYGRHRNPVYGTLTPNLGIEIVTKPHQEVHVVHAGYVFAVQPITGYGDVVFVSHGKYKTAYGNLSRVLVRKNTILKKGDLVGYSGDKNSTRGASVFFMLRSGSQNLDPEDWLKDQ